MKRGTFTNATVLRFAKDCEDKAVSALRAAIDEQVVTELPGPPQLSAIGFGGGVLETSFVLDGARCRALWFDVVEYRRHIPASAFKREVRARLEESQRLNGRRPGRALKRQIEEAVRADMLAKALITERRYGAHLVYEGGSPMLVVEAHGSAADRVAAMILDRTGGVARAWQATGSDRPLRDYIAHDLLPGIEPGDVIDMFDPADYSVTARLRGVSHESDEVQEFLSCGFGVSALELHLTNGNSSLAKGVLHKSGRVSAFSPCDFSSVDGENFESDEALAVANLTLWASSFQSWWKAAGWEEQ